MNNDPMERIQAELFGYDWFANVGGQFQWRENHKISKIESWEKAVAWSENKISWWCGNEYMNVLTSCLDDKFRKEYQNWNWVANKASRFLDSLLAEKIGPKIPTKYLESGISKWIKYQLSGVILEEAFSSLINLQLLSATKTIYKCGFFPCGIYVEKPKDFPELATIVVF